jgi:hypothetical protein
MQDNTKIIGVTDIKHAAADIAIPERYKDRVIEDREATQEEALLAMDPDVLSHADKPVAVWLDAQELGLHVARQGTPHEFNQMLLRKLRHAGAPVEGSDAGFLRLAHGAVAKVKPDPGKKEFGWRYLWLPTEYVAAIAAGVR